MNSLLFSFCKDAQALRIQKKTAQVMAFRGLLNTCLQLVFCLIAQVTHSRD